MEINFKTQPNTKIFPRRKYFNYNYFMLSLSTSESFLNEFSSRRSSDKSLGVRRSSGKQFSPSSTRSESSTAEITEFN